MSNSPLVSYTKLSPHCTKPRHDKIRGISIHTMAGPGSVEGCGQAFQTRKASSHYGIGPDGRIGQYVLEEDRAWCCSHKVDHSVVTIEVSSEQMYKEPYSCTTAAYKSLIALCVDICKRNNIKALLWREGKNYCPAYTGNWSLCNMVPHRYTSNKSCPGSYLFSRYMDIANEVNRKLNDKKETEMDIESLISAMTDEQAYRIVEKANRYASSLQEPIWSRTDGHWARAVSAGVVDGSAPERSMKRVEVIAVLGRLGIL